MSLPAKEVRSPASTARHRGGRRSLVPKWRIAIVVLALIMGQMALPTWRSGPKTCRSKDPTRVVSNPGGVCGRQPGGRAQRDRPRDAAWRVHLRGHRVLRRGEWSLRRLCDPDRGKRGHHYGDLPGPGVRDRRPDVITYQEELKLTGGTGLRRRDGHAQVAGVADLSTLAYSQTLTGAVSRPDAT